MARILLCPGWQDSGPDHWQSLWEAAHGDCRVQQSDWWHPLRGDWMMQLEEAVRADTSPVVLVAHSLGCHLVAAWSAHSQHTVQVKGALLVAPPDTERDTTPPQLHSWRPMRLQRLPFASVAVVSSDDPFCSEARGMALAQAWGSRLERAGPRGHLNSESGLGDWPQARGWVQALANGTTS
jgi:uncharacterized protein